MAEWREFAARLELPVSELIRMDHHEMVAAVITRINARERERRRHANQGAQSRIRRDAQALNSRDK